MEEIKEITWNTDTLEGVKIGIAWVAALLGRLELLSSDEASKFMQMAYEDFLRLKDRPHFLPPHMRVISAEERLARDMCRGLDIIEN